MSRGFVKDGDQEELPMVPKRAYLPEGVTNFVTRTGMEQLLAEKETLIRERDELNIAHENERRIAVNYVNAGLQLLNSRIAEARIVDPKDQPQDGVTFGATVTIKAVATGKLQTFQIVGVDESDISKGKISFISPLAKALLNKKTGERVALQREKEEIKYDIVDISCD